MIKTLQALRFVFIALVVASHIIGKSFDFGGECGVSFFFMLSGFILAYAYGGQVEAGIFGRRRFLLRQLSKFYPLHVLMMWVMVVLDARLGVTYSALKLLAQLFLLQSWVPADSFYFVANGSSWFLSDLLFFYVVFSTAYLLLMRASWRNIGYGIGVLLLLYLLLALTIPYDKVNALLYAQPLTRLLDFCIGILVYKFYRSDKALVQRTRLRRMDAPSMTALELLMMAYVVGSFFVYGLLTPRLRCAALFWCVLPVVLYVSVEADQCAGAVKRLLQTRPMQWLGSVSLEMFLTHMLTIRLLYSIFALDEEARLSPHVVLLTFVAVIAVSYLFKRCFVDVINAKLKTYLR